MLSGIRVYSSDSVWQKILSDFNATVLSAPDLADVNIDELNLTLPTTAFELKTAILAAMDNTKVLQKIFGRTIYLPQLQAQIIVWLDKTGGMSLPNLKNALGFLPNMTTHAVDTAIYQLRKTYGHDFIINKDGVYRLGKV